MEILKVNALADARTIQIVNDNFEPITGLITLIKNVPVEIDLYLYDLAGVAYTEEALSSYDWGFVIANDYNKETIPQLRANAISVAGNVLKIEIENMNTTELEALLGEEKSIRLGAELTGTKNNVDSWVLQFNVSVKNRRDSEGVPTAVSVNYYNKTEINDIIASVEAGNAELYNYYNKQEIDTALSVKADASTLNDFYNKIDVDAITNSINVNFDMYYSKLEIDGMIENLDVDIDLSAYYTKTEVDNTFLKIENLPAINGGTYAPRAIYSYFHITYGRSIYFDSLTTVNKFIDRVLNLKKIVLLAYSANSSFSGNVKLDFYINDMLIKTQTITTGTTATITFDTPVSGAIKIVRDYENSADTLKDGATTIAAIVPTLRFTEV